MLSSFHDDDLVREAVLAGAAGYILKGGSTAELVRALRVAAQGATPLDPVVAGRVLSIMRRSTQRGNPFADLTRREMEILALLSQGRTNAEIAAVLAMSEKTVRNHVSAILSKLRVENRVSAAMYASQNRIQDYVAEGAGGDAKP
jgi:DNA-binding NarL/FixJ family response regulator